MEAKTIVIQKYARRFLVNLNRKRYLNEKVFHHLKCFEGIRERTFSDTVRKFALRWKKITMEKREAKR